LTRSRLGPGRNGCSPLEWLLSQMPCRWWEISFFVLLPSLIPFTCVSTCVALWSVVWCSRWLILSGAWISTKIAYHALLLSCNGVAGWWRFSFPNTQDGVNELTGIFLRRHGGLKAKPKKPGSVVLSWQSACLGARGLMWLIRRMKIGSLSPDGVKSNMVFVPRRLFPSHVKHPVSMPV